MTHLARSESLPRRLTDADVAEVAERNEARIADLIRYWRAQDATEG
jgi:hypothetical protein